MLKKITKILLIVFGLLVLLLILVPGPEENQDASHAEHSEKVTSEAVAGKAEINTEELFDIRWDRADQHGITLAIDTTLPNNAEVSVSVRRLYEATMGGKTDTYSHEYFEEKGQVSQWRVLRNIPTDDAKWKRELKAEQDKLALLGADMAFEIDSIDSHIEVTAYAYAHKSGERFGAREYATLTDQVKDIELVGKSEVRAMRPLMNSGDIPKRSMLVSWDALEIGHSYQLLRENTPLMDLPKPGSSVKDTLETLGKTLYLPAGTIVHVEGMAGESGSRWYTVTLPQHPGRDGWINSKALMVDGAYRLSE